MTRLERRIYEREKAKINKKFYKTYCWFINTLFADNGYSYQRLWHWVNVFWKRVCDYYEKHFKVFKIDRYYFYNEFKPVESL